MKIRTLFVKICCRIQSQSWNLLRWFSKSEYLDTWAAPFRNSINMSPTNPLSGQLGRRQASSTSPYLQSRSMISTTFDRYRGKPNSLMQKDLIRPLKVWLQWQVLYVKTGWWRIGVQASLLSPFLPETITRISLSHSNYYGPFLPLSSYISDFSDEGVDRKSTERSSFYFLGRN